MVNLVTISISLPNEENDRHIIERWKNKSNYYNNAIYNWSIRDVEKRNEAKFNKLNYLEIFQNISFENIVSFIKEKYSETTENKQLIIGEK